MSRLTIDVQHIATVVQRPDEGGEGDAWMDLLRYGFVLSTSVEMACYARRDFGIRKHGRPVSSAGGTRDPDIDLLQELLDAVVYAWRGGRRDIADRLLSQIGDLLNDIEHKAVLRKMDLDAIVRAMDPR